MALNDIAIKGAKHGPKPMKLSDEKGLFLLLQPSGGKLWRLKYRFAGKEGSGPASSPTRATSRSCCARERIKASRSLATFASQTN